jgi:uncharacterized membrane protein
MAEQARVSGSELPPQYRVYFRIWFALGWPAFAVIVIIAAPMVCKPYL